MHTKVDSMLPFKQKFNLLKEFNQALIYGFDPEMSPQQLTGSSRWEDVFYPMVGQFEDMLDAYLFAQNNLIPLLKK